MWFELYEKLTNSEKEEFRRLLSSLLAHTFLIRDIYDTKENLMIVNPEYRFVERNFELFVEYLGFGGWALQKDSNYGVISLTNVYEYNRVRLDRNTTLILYTLRLIFEEEREKVALRNEILTTVANTVHKMITLGLIKKKPSDKDLIEALRQLDNYRVIQKIAGSWEDAESKLLILPSILFIVTNERISKLSEMYDAKDDQADSEVTEAAAATEEVIRGEDGAI
ncbi:MAG: DUF4194 domain-containing protein [Firmicutes bacterium]|nr:DUF4194 domain-containing protein [Bacillota bacterium]